MDGSCLRRLLCREPLVRALAEKGVPFDRVYVDLSAKPDWFKQLSPLGKVPLLQVDGDAAEYTGRGRELLIGFLVALAIL